MARKRSVFFRAIQSLLKLVRLRVCGGVFSDRLYLRGLTLLLLGIFLTTGIPPVLSQMPAISLIVQEQVDTQSGNEEGMISSRINQVQAFLALGRYRDAKELIEGVREKIEKLPESHIKAKGLRLDGDVLGIFGDLEKSQAALKKSIEIAERLQLSKDINAARLSLGNNLWVQGKKKVQLLKDDPTSTYDYIPWRCEPETKNIPENFIKDAEEDAKKFYQQAGEEYQKVIEKRSSPDMRIKAQLNHLSLLVETGKLAEAQKHWSEIDISDLPQKSQLGVYARINLAKNLACLNGKSSREEVSWKFIKELLVTAVQEAEKLEKIDEKKRTKSYALGNLAGLYEYLGLLNERHQQQTTSPNKQQDNKWREEAQKLTQQALLLTQRSEAPEIAYQWEWQLGRILKARGERKEAIAAYTEAIETIENFRQSLGGVAFNLDELYSDVQFGFRENIEPVYRQLIDLLLQPEKPSSEDIEKARQLIQEFQVAELESFLLCDLQQDKKRISIDDFITTNKLNTAVIYPIILSNEIGIILKLPNEKEPHYFRSEIPRDELESIQKNVILLKDSQPILPDIKEFCKKVYDLLIKPMENALKVSNVETLVFFLDSPLRNIPMAVLYDGNEYLIQKYAVVLSTGLLRRDTKPFKEVKLKSLIVAVEDPQYGNFEPLKYVGEEVNGIEGLLNKSKVFFDKKSTFTLKELEDEIKSIPYNLIHLATHGKFSSNLRETFILAAPGQDGQVSINQLGNWLQARQQNVSKTLELLVLSACETASGDKRAALGLTGVAVQTGASSTLATLWNVDDSSTAYLMKEFYTKLTDEKEKVSKAEALRRVQTDFLKQGREIDTRQWAPYVLVGDWR